MEEQSLDEVHIDELLDKIVEKRFSELYLEVGNAPSGRARGAARLEALKPYEALRRAIAQRLIYDILTDEQIVELEDKGALLFPYVAQHVAEFNVHVALTQGHLEATFHFVRGEPMTFRTKHSPLRRG